jgi:hypothetical protein
VRVSLLTPLSFFASWSRAIRITSLPIGSLRGGFAYARAEIGASALEGTRRCLSLCRGSLLACHVGRHARSKPLGQQRPENQCGEHQNENGVQHRAIQQPLARGVACIIGHQRGGQLRQGQRPNPSGLARPLILALAALGAMSSFVLNAESNGADLYLVANGGQPTANKTGANNPAIGLIAVLGSEPTANVVVNKMTAVASVWTNAQFRP